MRWLPDDRSASCERLVARPYWAGHPRPHPLALSASGGLQSVGEQSAWVARFFPCTAIYTASHSSSSAPSCGPMSGVCLRGFCTGSATKASTIYLLRCGKVILVFGPCADVRQANAVTALAQKLAAARENAQNSGSRRFQNSPPHTQ